MTGVGRSMEEDLEEFLQALDPVMKEIHHIAWESARGFVCTVQVGCGELQLAIDKERA